MEVRRFYFEKRHLAVISVKLGELKKTDLAVKLQEVKDQAIDKICGGVDLCKRAIGFCVAKEILPLKGIREKFAMDARNPFHGLMPKFNIKIDPPKTGSTGQAILSAIAKVKGAHNFFAEQIPESPGGSTPNATSIKIAFNTIVSLRERKTYKSISQIISNCKSNEKNSSNYIRRKISFLMYAGDNDVFFEYLGHIRDFQLIKKN
jgi:hypothetical protein